MFKVKRPAIVGVLIILLVFTGYLNYYLSQEAQIKSTSDYKNYELNEMARNFEEIEILQEDTIMEDTGSLEAMNLEEEKDFKNYFVEYRLSRDKLRANSIDNLDSIIRDEKTTEEVRADAQREIISIGKNSETELQIEGLIKGKGFDDAIVFLNESDIKIIVSTDELEEQDMVKILEIVKNETNFDTNNIKIMKKQ